MDLTARLSEPAASPRGAVSLRAFYYAYAIARTGPA
jgi:hypothetical protein